MATLPTSDLPVVDPKTGRISLEWYSAIKRLNTQLEQAVAGGVLTFEGRLGAVVSASGDYTASEITNVPAGDIAATDVQSAINELDSEKYNSGDSPSFVNETLTGYLDLTEIAAPTSPAANVARAYAADNSAGVTVISMKDSAGSIVPLSHFTQLGTGAATRTQHAKLTERRSVKDFGATGDGVTDDSAAIQAAFDAGAGEVFFPVGTYLAQALSWPSEIAITGENRDKTILKLTNSANTYLLASERYVNNSADPFPDGQNSIRNITLDGNKSNNTSGSCLIIRSYNAEIYRCVFQNAADNGVIQSATTASGSNGQNAAECIYRECRFTANGKRGFWAKDDSTGKIADVWLVDCWIHDNGTDGYYQIEAERAAGFHLHGCQLYSDYQGNIKLDAAGVCILTGCHLELSNLKGGTGNTYRNLEIGLGDGSGQNIGVIIDACLFWTQQADIASNTYKHIDFTASGAVANINNCSFGGPSGGWTNGAAIDRTAGSAIVGVIGSNNVYRNLTTAQLGQGYFDISQIVAAVSGSSAAVMSLASVNADGVIGPLVDLDRQSASPAANDSLASIRFRGRDSGGGSDTYAQITSTILDTTAASEDGALDIRAIVGGSDTLLLRAGANGVLVGHTDPITTEASGTAYTPRFQVIGASASASNGMSARFTADGNGPGFAFAKSRNATTGSHTVVQSGDELGRLSFAGSDGSNFAEGARIRCVVDGTPGTGDMPSALVFMTSSDGGESPGERLRVDSVGKVLASAPTGGMGYGTGAGSAVTQNTSKATGVTLNNICGQITMNNAALAAGASVSFTLTNSNIAATDNILVNHSASGGTSGAYRVICKTAQSGSCIIEVTNTTAGSLSEAAVINFSVFKAVAS